MTNSNISTKEYLIGVLVPLESKEAFDNLFNFHFLEGDSRTIRKLLMNHSSFHINRKFFVEIELSSLVSFQYDLEGLRDLDSLLAIAKTANIYSSQLLKDNKLNIANHLLIHPIPQKGEEYAIVWILVVEEDSKDSLFINLSELSGKTSLFVIH